MSERKSERKSKADLVSAIAAATGLAKTVISDVIEAKVGVVTDWVSEGKQVVLVGFGTYCVTERASRTGRNPQTGATIKIPAAKLPRFRAGKAFRDAVNNIKGK